MATEPIQGLPKPALTDAPNIESSFGTLIDGLVSRGVMRFANAANRGAVIPAPVSGMVTWLIAEQRLDHWSGTAWTPLTPGPWIPLTLAAGVVANAGSPSYRLINGSVELRGTLRKTDNSSFVAVSVLGSLPAAVRPGFNRYFTVATEWAAATSGRLEVGITDDTLTLVLNSTSGTLAKWVALDGVIFNI